METFEKQVMKQCPHCQRTFLEDRLAIHLRSCTAERPHKPISRPKSAFTQSLPGEIASEAKIPEEPSAEAFKLAGHRTSLEEFQDAEREVAALIEEDAVLEQEKTKNEQEEEEVQSDLDSPPPEFEENDDFLTEVVENRAAYYAMGVFSPKRKPKIPVKTEEIDKYALELPKVECEKCGKEVEEDEIVRHLVECERKSAEKEEKVLDLEEKPANIQIKSETIDTKDEKIALMEAVLPEIPTKESAKAVISDQIPEKQAISPPKVSISEPKPSKTVPKVRIAGSPSHITRAVAGPTAVEPIAMVTCQYCSRKFAPDAAERHISVCQDVRNRPKALLAPVRSSLQSLPAEKSPVRKHLDSNTLLKGTEECPHCHGLISGILLSSHLKVCRPAVSEKRSVPDRPSTAVPASKQHCAECGEKYLPEAKFCISCGAKR